jgi:hypothetical protein
MQCGILVTRREAAVGKRRANLQQAAKVSQTPAAQQASSAFVRRAFCFRKWARVWVGPEVVRYLPNKPHGRYFA